MIGVRSAFLMVSGVALRLAIVVTAWAGSKHGQPDPSDDGPFGGTALRVLGTTAAGASVDFTTTVPIGLAAGETLPSAALPSGVPAPTVNRSSEAANTLPRGRCNETIPRE